MANQRGTLSQLTSLATYHADEFMMLDGQTTRNLELFWGGRWGESDKSVLSTIDDTKTPMGARLLRNWLGHPLLDPAVIGKRQQVVASLCRDALSRRRIMSLLTDVVDLERLVNRIRIGKA